jgi:hypothetical protein
MDELLRHARGIELYSYADEVVRAILADDYLAALRASREAMREAHYRAKYNCAPIGPEGHVRNFESVKALRARLLRHTRI